MRCQIVTHRHYAQSRIQERLAWISKREPNRQENRDRTHNFRKVTLTDLSPSPKSSVSVMARTVEKNLGRSDCEDTWPYSCLPEEISVCTKYLTMATLFFTAVSGTKRLLLISHFFSHTVSGNNQIPVSHSLLFWLSAGHISFAISQHTKCLL